MRNNAMKAPVLAENFHTDPTRTVDLDSPASVLNAVDAILAKRYGPGYGRPILEKAMTDVALAFRGDYPGLLRCDTYYHDLRHALDAALAMTRLIDGYCKTVGPDASEAIDSELALFGVLMAMFHDIGLLRRPDEGHLNGASLTPVHERRGIHFLEHYLVQSPLAHLIPQTELIMITRLDYKMRQDWTPLQQVVASLLGTADLISQLADRCYLEKCRDFLFIEFSAIGLTGPGKPYPDQDTLLRNTPGFYTGLLRQRFVDEYRQADRYMAAHFDGVCPYAASIERNFGYLQTVLDAEDFTQLRRQPQRVIDAR